MLAAVGLVCVLVASVSAGSHPPHYKPRNYEFNYAVLDDATATNFGHQETRQDGQTTGSYRVVLPDGRLQVVTYTASPAGFVADVKYEGEAVFPPPPTFHHHHGHAPVFPPPPPPPPVFHHGHHQGHHHGHQGHHHSHVY